MSSWLNGVKVLQPGPTSAGEQQQNTASGFRTTVECFPEGMLSCTFGHFEKSLVSESECELKLLADRLSGESFFLLQFAPMLSAASNIICLTFVC